MKLYYFLIKYYKMDYRIVITMRKTGYVLHKDFETLELAMIKYNSSLKQMQELNIKCQIELNKRKNNIAV